MKRERRIPFLLFVVCLVAGMPLAWGAGGFTDLDVSKRGKPKVTLCHIPPGDPANAQTIVVGQAAVEAHLAHGDYLGECHQACDGVPSPVPKTGQTTCWDQSGSPIDCAGTRQDGELQKGVSTDPRFTDNGDGTVKDNLTGLIWLKNANCFGYLQWYDAVARPNTLASGACGLSDGSAAGAWRLPNIKELQSLIDFAQIYPALPAGHPFSMVQSSTYWSSTTNLYNQSLAWGVFLPSGDVYYASFKYYHYFVWPVRGGQ